MKVEGTYEIDADVETVWRWLNDPEVLVKCIPGVESLTPTGEHTYDAAIKISIGPVGGSYTGRVEVRDASPPHSYTLHIEGKGPGAFVSGDGRFRLSERDGGKTRVDVEGEAQIGGVFASVGQRMLGSGARTLMNQFFDALRKHAAAAKK